MDQLIPQWYRRYGEYVNSFRSFPLKDDGLKPVERRLLITAYLVARDKRVKSASVDGTCIAKYHPHGSCYGTIVQLVKNGFLEGQGNFGNSLGVDPSPPAAMRYTECKLPKSTLDMAFKYIKHVPYIEGELSNEEPAFLPTMFPFCLMGREYTQGIGFGFRTYVPCYRLEDLHKRLMFLLKVRKTKPTIRPITDCQILSPDTELETLLTTGKATIKVKGVIVITKTHCKARLKSWPPGRRFESILGKFKKELENNDIGFIDQSNDEVGTAIDFTVLKQRNRDKIFSSFVKKLEAAVTGTISFEAITVDRNSHVNLTSVDEMLLGTYVNFKEVNEAMLKYEIQKNNSMIKELQDLEKIRAPLSAILKQTPGRLTKKLLEKSIKFISDKSGVPVKTVKELIAKYHIQKLLTVDTDTGELRQKGKELTSSLKNIDQFVLSQYDAVK